MTFESKPSFPLREAQDLQERFAFNDETKAVAFLKKYRCPTCNGLAALWRICKPGNPDLFQVRCMHGEPFLACGQPPIPHPPINNSQGAVRAWILAVKLAEL